MSNAAITTTIGEFLNRYSVDRFVKECHKYVQKDCAFIVKDSHDNSWKNCGKFLNKYLPSGSKYKDFHLIFEFLMPESMKRADAIILTKKKVIVLVFNQKKEIKKNDIAQTAGYSRSIAHFHFATEENDMQSIPYMVYTPGKPKGRANILTILHPANFTAKIKEILENEEPMTKEECLEWVNAPYHPLESLAESTLQLFRDGNLPNIKSIRDGDIQDTVNFINQKIEDKKLAKSIIFVAGVPGAGKTLVGLKIVYDHGKSSKQTNPIYLSGNDPLINILQNTLSRNKTDRDGESYIQAMKKFKRLAYGDAVPMNNIIVFDEAQRAWDIGKAPYKNEAEQLLAIGNKVQHKYGKVTIVCLIGEGQAIHLREETGMPMWGKALEQKKDWNVFIPDQYAKIFSKVPHCHNVHELMLDTSIRNDFINVNPWVEAILDLDLSKAKAAYQEMLSQGFKCWIFRNKENLSKSIKYVEEQFPGSHTGLIVSSHLNNPDGKYGKTFFGSQYKGSYIRAEDAYWWYREESRTLRRAASEFLIQGLELDIPIVGFIGDYFIKDGKWVVKKNAKDPGLKDLEAVIKNVYRVLMTRSRKGIFIYFPRAAKQLDETYDWFSQMLNINDEI